MSTRTYAQTHETILNKGKELFLKEGFERANLREICRLSGITTGGFYRHFKDKADLFSALVEPAVQGLLEQYSASEKLCFSVLEEGGIEEIWKVSAEALEDFVSYIFDNLEAFKLVLCCASGTEYADFTDWMVKREMKDMYKTYELLEKKGIAVRRLPEKELHMLTHAYFSCIFETVLHNFSKEDALQSMKTLAEFFSAGWRKVFGVEDGEK
ncbi:TetR/AcrR family transcriptional regulator [Treponema sp. OMZ 787]|uniref:TetR/AcrR family transcriptional regulator n=1 Tax=Treponema sp. OMZ 787 TaxID=2563669 RepID=UPI0020A44DB0|nr:TetR/AcrR family transcriptional regulator [Treponema sp. OMZ 787]UTC61459.1 TetR/AcrR family transcriptional regulator [Treponema sp. OMZ 787]